MSAGTDIAAEVAAGIIEAATDTGAGKYLCALARLNTGDTTPWGANPDAYDMFEVSAVKMGDVKSFDTGAVREDRQSVLVDPTGPEPKRGDLIALGLPLASADITDKSQWKTILTVTVISPSGIPLLYKCEVEK